MCNEGTCTLTAASLLHDPLIRMVMASDKVSDEDMERLLERAYAAVMAREERPEVYRA